MNGFLHIFYMAFASFFTLNHSVFCGVPGFLQRTANDFLFRKTDCGFINRQEREQKRPPDGGLFDLSGEMLTGWRSRKQLKTHPQKNAADYGKSIQEIVEWFDQQF